ncbi:MAG: MlaE family lipid ABC transporter permease subunit [bacterium]|nr:MlaE family lipid ABC transporter permease subunit [bacterium]
MPAHQSQQTSGQLVFESEHIDGVLTLRLMGQLNVESVGGAWRQTLRLLNTLKPARLRLDASRLMYCDGAGVGYIAECRRRMGTPPNADVAATTTRIESTVETQSDAGERKSDAPFELIGASEDLNALIEMYGSADFERLEKHEVIYSNLPDSIGRATLEIFEEKFRQRTIFLGEFFYYALRALLKPFSLRWGETLQVAEKVGVNALPIIILIGFLLGLIMAFQSAIPMRIYGAEIFVANLVGLSLLRELGPLITAVILAGRTGSSFAAELGTMKINEEIDAMTTMGVEPMRFLVLPRIVAAVAMVPLLTLFFNISGLIGGFTVLKSFGYPLVVYYNQVLSAVDMTDLMSGLLKSTVFGALVAGIGCYMGLHTKSGAGAVGESTTRAVVSGIIAIAVVDGIFAVIFYLLDI